VHKRQRRHLAARSDHAVNVPSPGVVVGQDTLVLGNFLRDVATLNQDQRNFRIFGPDEVHEMPENESSNSWGVFLMTIVRPRLI